MCVPCQKQCDLGFYKEGECDGTAYNDTTTCVRCKQSCSAGQYISGVCDGTSDRDTTQCISCKDCGGQHVIDECDGKGIRDTQKVSLLSENVRGLRYLGMRLLTSDAAFGASTRVMFLGYFFMVGKS